MKKLIFFIIKLLAIAGGLAFIYASITGEGLVTAQLVNAEWVRVADGVIGLAIFMSVFTRLSDTK